MHSLCYFENDSATCEERNVLGSRQKGSWRWVVRGLTPEGLCASSTRSERVGGNVSSRREASGGEAVVAAVLAALSVFGMTDMLMYQANDLRFW